MLNLEVFSRSSFEYKSSKAKTAICYVADKDFVFGTLLSILSLKKTCSTNEYEVYLFLVDFEIQDKPDFIKFAERNAIKIIEIRSSIYAKADADKWNKTHVPTSTLGRFFIEQYLPDNIEKILYLDGDTIIQSDISELIQFKPPAGHIAAAEDISYFVQFDEDKHGSKVKSYFDGIGISGSNSYFNAGVLIANRVDWSAICQDAYDFLLHHTKQCLYHDQSALNAVSIGRRVRLSPKWNFQTSYRYWGVERDVKPRILHFTEFPKPWMSRVYPWISASSLMDVLSADINHLNLNKNLLNGNRQKILNKQNIGRMIRVRTIYRKRLLSRRKLIHQLSFSAAI